MKKNIIINSLACSLFFSLIACEEKLELKPEQSLTGETAFANEATTMSTLRGVYSTAQLLEVYGSLPQVIADYQADNVDFVGSFPTLQEINTYTTVAANVSIRDIWAFNYRTILRANKVIATAPSVNDAGFTDAEKKMVVAEAKFIRALVYFQLANLFSQPYQVASGANPSVPLVLEAFEGEISFPARATLNEVHAQIKKDLTEALPDLQASLASASETRGRATKGAANALLSRFYLYRGEWANAEAAARAVLTNSSLYALAPDYKFFDSNTSEIVFAVQNTVTDNGRTGSGGWASYYQPTAKGGRGDAPFSAGLLAAYREEAGDKRLTELSATGVASDGQTKTFSLKFPKAVTNEDDSPVLRVTEVVLNLAEALAEQQAIGVNLEALDLINQLRSRAGLTPYSLLSFLSKEAFIEAILKERRKELAFEGHRRMDLLRRRQPLRTTGPEAAKAGFGAGYTILPIPQRELDINPSLVQNDAWK